MRGLLFALELFALLCALLWARAQSESTSTSAPGLRPLPLGSRRGARPSIVVVSSLDGTVTGFDAATGTELFAVRSEAPALKSWAKAGSPEYIPTLDGALYRLDATTNEAVSVDPRFIEGSGADEDGGGRHVLAKPSARQNSAGGVVLTSQRTSALYVNLRTGNVVRSISFEGGKDGLKREATAGVRPGDDIVLLSQSTMEVRVTAADSMEEIANATLTHTNPSFLSRGQCIVAPIKSAASVYSASVSDDRSKIIVRGKDGRVIWDKKVDSAVVEAHGMGAVAVASAGEMSALPGGDEEETPRPDGKALSLVVAREGGSRYMKRAPAESQKEGDATAIVWKVRQPMREGGLGVASPHSAGEQGDGMALLFSLVVVICLMAGYAMGRRPRRRSRTADPTARAIANGRANGDLAHFASFDDLPTAELLPTDDDANPSAEMLSATRRSPGRTSVKSARNPPKIGDAEAHLESNGSTGSRSSGGVTSSRTETGWMTVGCLQVSSEVLGIGSHGTVVYEGKMHPGGRRVAVKRLLRQFYDSARKEISLLVELDEASPYVVRYFAMEEDSEFIYLALELCSGTLGDRVTSHSSPAPPKQYAHGPAPVATVRALRQLLQGLAGLHRAGVVHRDVKPQNVLLSRNSPSSGAADIKLADVGLALRLAANRSSYTAVSNAGGGVGTTGWRAPEVLRGGRQTKAVDIFAAGCVVGFVLTGGQHPFGTAIFGRDGNIAANRPVLEPLEGLELPEAVDIVQKMIHPDFTQRPTAEAALCHPFFWTDSMKLSFLVDISDRLYDLRNEPARYTENMDRSPIAVASCNDWIVQMDMELLQELGRTYDCTASGLLRVIRNKKNHYSELASSLQKLLGRLPEDESSDGSEETDENGLHAHNFLTYFTSRVPHLLMCAYEYALAHPALIEQPHFTRYGFKIVTRRENPALHPRVRRLQLNRLGVPIEVGDGDLEENEGPSTPRRRLYARYQLVELQKSAPQLSQELKDRLRECEMLSEECKERWTRRLATGVFEQIEGATGVVVHDGDEGATAGTAAAPVNYASAAREATTAANASGMRMPSAAPPPGFDRPRFRSSAGFPPPASAPRAAPARGGPPGFAAAAAADGEPAFGTSPQGGPPGFGGAPGFRSIASVGNRRARMSGQMPTQNGGGGGAGEERRVIDFGALRRK